MNDKDYNKFFETYGTREGNFEFNIVSSVKIKTCSGCKFYSKKLFKSGKSPIHGHICNHNDAPDITVFENIPNEELNGYVVTPKWCPFNEKE